MPKNVQQLIARYGNLKDENGAASWSDFTFMQEAANGTDSICTKREGNFNEYIMQTEQVCHVRRR
jgi:hypothetical protein